jgi:hypothetical protein
VLVRDGYLAAEAGQFPSANGHSAKSPGPRFVPQIICRLDKDSGITQTGILTNLQEDFRMSTQAAHPVGPDDRVPPLTAPPISNDCDQALRWFHSWAKTFKMVFRAGGTWDSACLLMHLCIKSEYDADGGSGARDDELMKASGLSSQQYQYVLRQLQSRRLIDVNVLPENGDEVKTIRLADGRFKRYTITSGDVTTSFWAAVGSKVQCT